MSARHAFAALLAVLLLSGARVSAQAPAPPYPNPPPYPPYPDPGPAPSEAPWPEGGTPLCVAPGDQRDLSATNDYAHGAYFAWSDHRGSDFDVYAIRIGPDGHPAAGWTVNGSLVAGGAGDQTAVACVNDGPWGTYVAWIDQGSGSPHLFVQRLAPDGSIAPGWPAGGTQICAGGTQAVVWAFPDRQGGIQFLWTGTIGTDTYATAYHMAPDGSPYTGWPVCGVTAAELYHQTSCCLEGSCCGSLDSFLPSDPAPCWPDGLFLGTYQIYTQCECVGGVCYGCPYFGCSGSELFQDAGRNQDETPVQGCNTWAVFPDEAGGFIELGYNTSIVYRVGVLGNPSWSLYAPAYAPIAAGDGTFYLQLSDGSYVRLLNDGTVAPGWSLADPLLPCASPCVSVLSDGVPDGAGGLFVAWDESSNGAGDIYTTHILGDGTRDPAWPARGFPVATGPADQVLDAVIPDRRGNAIVAWHDNRTGDDNLYAYRLSNNQPVPVLASLVSSSATPDRVEIVWWVASPGALTVERRAAGTTWQWLANVAPDSRGQARVVDNSVRPGARYDYRLSSSGHVLSETTIEVPVALVFAFEGARPNPTSGSLEVAFTLPEEGDVVLRVRDVGGRQVRVRRLGATDPGHHTAVLARPGELPPGIYFVEFEAGRNRGTRRAIVIH